ncbi:MAG: molybdate ABC transporter permease subunit [Myxococcales bacterium]
MSFQPLALSFQIAVIATVLALLVGVSVAAIAALWRSRLGDLLDALITAPMVLPPTVLGYYLLVALGRQSVIGRAFESLTGSSIVFTRSGAVVAATFGALPLITKAARAAMEDVDPTLVAAARSLGATSLRAFTSVTLPLARGGIVAGATLGFARALGDFGVTLMLAGNIPGLTRTASLAIYDAVQANREQEALGMVLVLSALALATLYTVNRLQRRSYRGL